MFDRAKFIADLERDEGFVPYLYDDANDERVVKGYRLLGNPTVGIGWCPATRPIPRDQARIICGWQADDVASQINPALPWFGNLDDVRSRAVMNMAFQMGVHGVLEFQQMLNAMGAQRWDAAATAALESAWARQTPRRANRIAEMIRTGAEQ